MEGEKRSDFRGQNFIFLHYLSPSFNPVIHITRSFMSLAREEKRGKMFGKEQEQVVELGKKEETPASPSLTLLRRKGREEKRSET